MRKTDKIDIGIVIIIAIAFGSMFYLSHKAHATRINSDEKFNRNICLVDVKERPNYYIIPDTV